MSDPLIWLCVKDYNSFQRKRGNTSFRRGTITLSAEPGNLTSTNSYKASGIANVKAIEISSTVVDREGKKDNKIVMRLKVSLRAIGSGGARGSVWFRASHVKNAFLAHSSPRVLCLQNTKKANKPAKGLATTPLRFKNYMGAEACIASQVALPDRTPCL
jgi:hypothetical protein